MATARPIYGTLQEAPARPTRNRILAALPAAQYARLALALERVDLRVREVMFDVDRPIDHVFFPEDSVVSIVSVLRDGTAVETATVGYEGMVGLAAFHGATQTSVQAFCQIPGAAYRLTSAALRQEAECGGELRAVLDRYTHALFIQVAQSSACNRRHTMRERCARWLLQVHDRLERDDFPLTQQFLSQMLGVRRATVSEAAGALQSDGLITYEYGHITIRDRAGLEAAACECYAIIRREYARLLEGRDSPGVLRSVQTTQGGMSVLGDGAPPASSADRPD